MNTKQCKSRNSARSGAALRWASLLVAIPPLLAAAAAPANGLGPTDCESLLTNGSFETTPTVIFDGGFRHYSDVGAQDVAGWELVAGNAIEIQRNINGTAAHGDHFLELASSSPTTISQSVTVTPGALYELRFAYSDRPGFGDDNEFRVTWGDVERTLGAPGVGRTSWQYASLTAAAPTDGTGLVTFEDVSGGNPAAGMLIDDVTLCRAEDPGPAARCRDVTTVTDEGLCSASGVSIDDGSSGSDGGPVAVSQIPPAPYGLGETLVTLVVEDGQGRTATCQATVTVEDRAAPVVECNAPSTLRPPDAPVSWTGTATDNCSVAAVEVGRYDCWTVNGAGKRVDKTGSCVVSVEGATLTVHDSGGVGTLITWEASATDGSGNSITRRCETEVVNPGRGKGRAGD